MKLRNKKTGEIIDNAYIRESHDFYNKRTIAVFVRDGNRPPERVSTGYETLAELNAEWEDYEEPEMFYWYIDWNGEVCRSDIHDERTEQMKQIGNFFKTEEKAEKAVEKLKAWKRLKDDDFKFEDWYYDVEPIRNGRLNIQIRATLDENDIASLSDLNLLFSQEDD